jgi:hypothetical protein
MLKLSKIWFVSAIVITALTWLCLRSIEGKPAKAETSKLHSFNQSTIIATASATPKLVSAFLGGKPVHVLYVTQPEDTILVRCYPNYEPTLELRAMGSNSNSNTQKEGVMICRPST